MSDNDDTGLKRRLAEVLTIYGADPERWPPDERVRLMAVLDEMEAAVADAGEERALDALLDLVDEPEPPDGSVERVLAAAGLGEGADVIAFAPGPRDGGGQAPPRTSVFPFRPMVGWAAASLLLGVIVGSSDIADPIDLGDWGSSAAEAEDLGGGVLDLEGGEYGSDEDDL